MLRCQWCCNPETQEYKIQTMKTPDGVKTMGRDVTVREMMEVVEKDRPYYYGSGGGMTLSGGECLCQPEFARDLLRAAKERGINTAIESMACVPWKNIEMALPYLDTYLMDISIPIRKSTPGLQGSQMDLPLRMPERLRCPDRLAW